MTIELPGGGGEDDGEEKDMFSKIQGCLMTLVMITVGRILRSAQRLKMEQRNTVVRFTWDQAPQPTPVQRD